MTYETTSPLDVVQEITDMSTFLVPMAVYIISCLIVGVVASKRTIRFWGGVVLAVVVTPILAAAILILTRQRPNTRRIPARAQR